MDIKKPIVKYKFSILKNVTDYSFGNFYKIKFAQLNIVARNSLIQLKHSCFFAPVKIVLAEYNAAAITINISFGYPSENF